MYICQDCGNYMDFTGGGNVKITNKVYKEGEDFRAEAEEELDETTFVFCTECGGDNVVDVFIDTLPKEVQKAIYDSIETGLGRDEGLKNKLKGEVQR